MINEILNSIGIILLAFGLIGALINLNRLDKIIIEINRKLDIILKEKYGS